MTVPGVLDAENLRDRVQAVLDDFLDSRAEVLAEVSEECAPLIGAVRALVAGGKRLRPAFCYWGWRAACPLPSGAARPGLRSDAGGVEPAAVVRAAASLELFQAAALIHDDVMDASDTRRGAPAVHRAFEALHQRSGWSGDGARFGVAGAILSGDLCLAWSDELLTASGLGAPEVARVRGVYDVMRTQLMGGQYLDMLAEVRPLLGVPGVASGPDEAEVDELLALARRVIAYKSAKYTIEQPLLVGAAVAGAPPAVREAYSAYGMALGEAFQLRDDVLGVFGDPEETGKPAGDDLREGKRTVLVVLALQRATPAQVDVLHRLLGDPSLDDAGVAALREVVVETGALERVEAMIGDGVARARAVLATAPLETDGREALSGLVDAATARVA